MTNFNGEIKEDILKVWGNRLYGCTTCQEVCPKNKDLKPESPKTEIGIVGEYLPLIELLNMDEKRYRERFKDNQITARWINFDCIKRNALIALGNIKDDKTIKTIEYFTKSNIPMLKNTALWALRNFDS